ncbi:MAG: SMP-30/gluconolactonase/LRE family protein [Actinomycetota bacterium]
MTSPGIDVVSTEPSLLGECPLWVGDEQVLYWEDIDGCAINRYDPSSGEVTSCALPARPGSFVLTSQPGVFLVATEHEVVWLDWSMGHIVPWLALENEGAGIRMNDGRTDSAGRFWVGSMFEDTGADKRVGSLHRIDADGTATVERTGIGVTNGIAFDPSRSRMYFADTPTMSVRTWTYDPADGSRTEEREFFDYTTVDGKPDGACVDADGCYWSASVHGWAVTRVTPDGVVDRRIDLPVRKPSMPAFGGANLDTLFVTSIAEGDDPPADPRRQGVAPGSLFAIDLSGDAVTGVLETPFAGTPPAMDATGGR